MKLFAKKLRHIIREVIVGSQPDETYSEELLDDQGFKEKCVLTRVDAKKKIKAWAKDMKLSTK